MVLRHGLVTRWRSSSLAGAPRHSLALLVTRSLTLTPFLGKSRGSVVVTWGPAGLRRRLLRSRSWWPSPDPARSIRLRGRLVFDRRCVSFLRGMITRRSPSALRKVRGGSVRGSSVPRSASMAHRSFAGARSAPRPGGGDRPMKQTLPLRLPLGGASHRSQPSRSSRGHRCGRRDASGEPSPHRGTRSCRCAVEAVSVRGGSDVASELSRHLALIEVAALGGDRRDRLVGGGQERGRVLGA